MRRKTKITSIQIAEPLDGGTGEPATGTDTAGAATTTTEAPPAATVLADPITIKKAKLKDDMFLDLVEYSEETKDGKNDVIKTCTAVAHDDLKTAFHQLDNHLCRLAEQYDVFGDMDYSKVAARSFSIAGKGAKEGLVISGYRILGNGAYLNINTPFTTWDSEYGYISELSQVIEECKHEIKEYLFNNKHQPEAQQELPFDKGYNDEAASAPYAEEEL